MNSCFVKGGSRQARKGSIGARKSEDRHADNEVRTKFGALVLSFTRNADPVRAFEYQVKTDRTTSEDINRSMRHIAPTIGVPFFLLGVEPGSVDRCIYTHISEEFKLSKREARLQPLSKEHLGALYSRDSDMGLPH